jgi:hypothetical protein
LAEESNKASQRAQELQKNMERMGHATTKEKRELKEASAEAKKLYAEWLKNHFALQDVQKSMADAGVSAGNLREQLAQLAAQDEKTREAQGKLIQAHQKFSQAQKALSWEGIRGEYLTVMGIARGFKTMTSSAMTFESSMADMAKVGNFETPQELEEMGDRFLKMSRIIPMSMEGLQEIGVSALSAGIPKDEVDDFAETPEWKRLHSYTDTHQITCWPKGKLGDKIFHLSTIFACVCADTDDEYGGVPYASPSNHLSKMAAAVTDAGKELLLDLNQANYLNGNGIVTLFNWESGWMLWGDETACYPLNLRIRKPRMKH